MTKDKLRMVNAKLTGPETGFGCPACGVGGTLTIDTRTNSAATSTRRRRACHACGHRFTTYELAAHPAKSAMIANIRTAHLDLLVGNLKLAIEEYEQTRMHPIETWGEPMTATVEPPSALPEDGR